MENNQRLRKKLYIIVYVVAMVANIIWAIHLHQGFSSTYGSMAFSKGVLGILICNGGNIIIFVVASVMLIQYLKKQK